MKGRPRAEDVRSQLFGARHRTRVIRTPTVALSVQQHLANFFAGDGVVGDVKLTRERAHRQILGHQSCTLHGRIRHAVPSRWFQGIPATEEDGWCVNHS